MRGIAVSICVVLSTSIVLFVSTSCRPPLPKRSIEVSLSAQHFEGSNGIRVFTVPDKGAEFVTIHVRYQTGGVDDPVGKEGLAHLVEHLMFTRTITLGGRERTIGSRIDEIALFHNAMTRHDITHYLTMVPREALSEMFAIETVRITGGCQGLSEQDFAREKEVVRNEIRWRSSGDMGKIYPASLKAFYGDHPYARPVGGSDVSLQAITLADVCAFMKDNYAPSKATFYVVGNVTTDETRKAAVDWLTRIPPRTVPPQRVIPRATIKPGRQTITLDVESPYVVAGWRLPIEHEAYPLINRAMNTLSSRMSGFAFRYEFGLGADVNRHGGARAPIAVMTAKLRSIAKIGAGIDAIKKSGNAVEFGLPTAADDMESTRFWATERLLASFESPLDRGVAFADLDDRSNGTRFLVEEVAALDSVSNGALRSMASDTFDFDRAAVLVIKPSGKVQAGSGSGASFTHQSNKWKVKVDAQMANAPHPLPRIERRNVVVSDYKLSSGMRVVLAESGDLPLTRAYLSFAVGSSAEPSNKPGLATLAGSFQGALVTTDETVYLSRELKTRIDYLVRGIAWGTRGYGYDQRAIEKARGAVQQSLRQPSAAASSRYRRQMHRQLYGEDHPYANRGFPKAKDIGEINRDELGSFGRRYYGGASGTLIISGQYDIVLMKAYIEKTFDHWEKRSRPKPAPAVDFEEVTAGIVIGLDPSASQLSIEVSFAGPTGIDQLYPARRVLAAMIGANLRALREERGLTYGAGASFEPALGPGRWTLSANVDPSRAEEGTRAVLHALAAVRGDTRTVQFLTNFVGARKSVIDSELLSRALPSSTLANLAFATRFDLPLDYRSELARLVAQVTPDQVRTLIHSELRPSRQVLGLLGSASAVAGGKRGTVAATPAVIPTSPSSVDAN